MRKQMCIGIAEIKDKPTRKKTMPENLLKCFTRFCGINAATNTRQ